MAPTAPRTPAEHHYDLGDSGLADLGRVGFDDGGPDGGGSGRAHTRAALAIAAIPRRRRQKRQTVGETDKRPCRFIRAGRCVLNGRYSWSHDSLLPHRRSGVTVGARIR